jgi:hypothetical protein
MKLADWFNHPNPDGSRRSKGAFATAIGVTPQVISAYCNGDYLPQATRMEVIARETGGDVMPNDWFSINEQQGAA